MDPVTDIELTIHDLDPEQTRDVWARINIIAASFITDGHNVSYGRDTHTPYTSHDDDTEDES